MKFQFFILSIFLLFGCVKNPPKPTVSPSTQTTIPQTTDTSIFNGFNGQVFISKTYTVITNEEPEQFLNDVSTIGISDSVVIISCTTFKSKTFIKGTEFESNSPNKLFFLDFTSNSLKDTVNYDAVLFYNKTRESIQFHYGGQAFFFYDVSEK